MDYKEKVIALLNSKELSKEQKEKLEDIFPELKESEDERIRKDIIILVKDWWDRVAKDNISTKERMIDWLEKQAQNPAWSEEDKNMLKWVIGYLENKMLNTPISEERIACKNAIAWLLEKQAQKPVDKVEPKFKVGDWISGYYTNYKVLSVNNNGYVVEDVDGNKINILFENEKFHHLWTIQDAKDGDVLVCESGWTCIFKKLNHNSFGEILFDSYCFIDRTGWFCDGAKGHTLNERINGKIYPATKEQRERLEKAMADAGYTFDFEKKELKKIEQKLADNVEPKKIKKTKFKTGDRIIGIVSGMQYYITKVCDDHYCTESGCIIMFCAQENFELYKQKPAWSEEDERIYQSIIALCDEKMKSTSYQSVIDHAIDVKNWLKSLKDRVQSQSRWKPSEVQMKALRSAIHSYGTHCGSDPLYHVVLTLEKDLRAL